MASDAIPNASTYNLKNPAVKRILQEVKELQENRGKDYWAEPLEDNLFEWHFAIRGPPDTEFEGGVYHGRILLPPEYPFKPPAFMLLTPNGRFETQKKVCLSISHHHPEHWQPSWGVRTALLALIAFLPTPAEGAVGSLEYTKEERRKLAARSRSQYPTFGNEERQAITKRVHEMMVVENEMQSDQPVPVQPSTVEMEGLTRKGTEQTSDSGDVTPQTDRFAEEEMGDLKINQGSTSSLERSEKSRADVVASDGDVSDPADDQGKEGKERCVQSSTGPSQNVDAGTTFGSWFDTKESDEIEAVEETPTEDPGKEHLVQVGLGTLDDPLLTKLIIAIATLMVAIIAKKLVTAFHEASLEL